ncbi:hypothetical protein ACE3MZ_05525 [Paenibacillus sp. WLX1005]|uniref:hypothetical protein n=1 Tax=Paenibacillus sp. WLX1005 TaxID=3243766 RepID=UPI0039841BA4
MKISDDLQTNHKATYAEEEQPSYLAVKTSISNARAQLVIAALVLVVSVVLFIEWQW